MAPFIFITVVTLLGLVAFLFLSMTNYDKAHIDPFMKAHGRKVTINIYRDYIHTDTIQTTISDTEPDEYDPSMIHINFRNGFVVVLKRSSYHVEPFTHYSVMGVADDDSVIEYRIKFQ